MKNTQKIQTVQAGKDPWSPRYKKLRNQIDLWRKITRWKKGKNTSRTSMKRLAKKIDLD